MKPHQETWRREHLLVVVDEGDGYDLGASCFGSGALPFVNHDVDIARLNLAAQAPAMARLLLECQYVEMSDERGGYEQRCAICLNRETLPTDANGHVFIKEHLPQHAPDCALVAVLRAAGVLA